MDPIVPHNVRITIKHKIDDNNNDNLNVNLEAKKIKISDKSSDVETEIDEIYIIARSLYLKNNLIAKKYIEKILNNNNYVYHYLYILILNQLKLYVDFFKYIEEIYKLIENVETIDPKMITDNSIGNIEQFKNILYILHIKNIINSKSIDSMQLIFELYCKICENAEHKKHVLKYIEKFCKDNNNTDILIKIYEKDNLYKDAAFYYIDNKLYEKGNFYLKKIIDEKAINYIKSDIIYFIGSIKEITFDDSIYKIEKFYKYSELIEGYDLSKKIYKLVDDIKKLEIIHIIIKYEKHLYNKSPQNYISAISIYENLNDTDKKIIQGKFDKIIESFNTYISSNNNIINYAQYYSYFNKKNKDLHLKEFIEYIKLDLIFKDIKNNIKENSCTICVEKSHLISLNCHQSHEICYKCYEKMNKCPYCRDSYKETNHYNNDDD
jgi:hypothetical protein